MWQRWNHAARFLGLFVSRVVVAVSRGEHHPRRPDGREHVVGADGETHEPSGPITPGSRLIVPPPAIAETEHRPVVRAPAALAPALGAAEADQRRQLALVDRVEEPMLSADRHDRAQGNGCNNPDDLRLSGHCHCSIP